MKPLPLPRFIESAQTAKFHFDLAAPAHGWKQAMRIRIQTDKSLKDLELIANFNDEAIPPTPDTSEPFSVPYPSMLAKPEELRAWLIPSKLLREGRNTFSVSLKSGTPFSLQFVDLASQTALQIDRTNRP
jgi:hypothetical protein